MADIDFFKAYNDREGHQAGDEVLRNVARALAAVCRRGDMVYRYGGEEFLLILPASSLEEACVGAERFRAAIESLQIPHSASPFKIVTMSAGAAVLGRSETSASWLKRADDALYDAKNLGRNCVASAGSVREVRRQDMPLEGSARRE